MSVHDCILPFPLRAQCLGELRGGEKREVIFLLCVESKSQATSEAEDQWYLKRAQRDAQGMFLDFFFLYIYTLSGFFTAID